MSAQEPESRGPTPAALPAVGHGTQLRPPVGVGTLFIKHGTKRVVNFSNLAIFLPEHPGMGFTGQSVSEV